MMEPGRHRDRDRGIHYGLEEARRMEELDEQGLCVRCGKRPQNPALSTKRCLDCCNETGDNCDAGSCTRSIEGTFMQHRYCKRHLIDSLHKAYTEYLKKRSKLQKEQQRILDKAADIDFDVEAYNADPRKLTDRESKIYNDWLDCRINKRENEQMRGFIIDSMGQVEQVFPKGFSTNL